MLLTIRHRTTYRYRQPVAFGEHRMMLRPRDCADQRVLDLQLAIDPVPGQLAQHRGRLRQPHRHRDLRRPRPHALLREHRPCRARTRDPGPDPTGVDAGDAEDPTALAPYLARDPATLGAEVNAFARRFRAEGESIGAWPLLCTLSDGIHCDFADRRREAKGTQSPRETLRLGHGSCRDFAVLMIAAARALGFAARFASGYLASAFNLGDAEAPDYTGGNTHAWAQVYLPRLGWIDFDPDQRHHRPAGPDHRRGGGTAGRGVAALRHLPRFPRGQYRHGRRGDDHRRTAPPRRNAPRNA